MTPAVRGARTASPPNEAESTKTVNRNFALPVEQAEWLRVAAFENRVPQAALVREAIEDLKRKYERRRGQS